MGSLNSCPNDVRPLEIRKACQVSHFWWFYDLFCRRKSSSYLKVVYIWWDIQVYHWEIGERNSLQRIEVRGGGVCQDTPPSFIFNLLQHDISLLFLLDDWKLSQNVRLTFGKRGVKALAVFLCLFVLSNLTFTRAPALSAVACLWTFSRTWMRGKCCSSCIRKKRKETPATEKLECEE